MPFFSAWIDKADRKMKQTYLWIWVISLFLPYMGEYISHYLYGTATWNEFGTLYYFAGFNGYLLLGHYVKQGNSWSVGKTLLLSALLFAAGYSVTFTGFSAAAHNPAATESDMELFFTFSGFAKSSRLYARPHPFARQYHEMWFRHLHGTLLSSRPGLFTDR